VPTEFRTVLVDKKISEFPDTLDLSSPLKAGISIYYLSVHGKNSDWRRVSSERIKLFLPDTSSANSDVPENIRSKYLNTIIKEIITYKDSIACVISQVRDSLYSIRWLCLENGNWVNNGEDGRRSIEESNHFFQEFAEENMKTLRKINVFSSSPKDTSSFITYIKEYGQNPKDFLLDKLGKYKLVMYGEIHRRKVSWDFLEEVVSDKRFIDRTGTIFMELGSDKQGDIDTFLSNKSIDKELLLNVFRDYILPGWDVKDEFDFIKDIWLLNKNLPSDKKVKIIACDTPRPFASFTSKDDIRDSDAKYDRDTFMADTILNYLNLSKDNRSAIFIVGSGHVQKKSNSAGSILSNKMPQATYTIFQHSPRVDNFLRIYQSLRHGVFDYAFSKNGDKPIAFDLKSSPFGKEPFDAFYFEGNGTYQDNYDGYIFFGSLDNEVNGEILLDLYSDDFVAELDRRYKLYGSDLKNEWKLSELSKKAITEKILSDYSKTRWGDIIKTK
jgi:uncharacterized iron-regulated protein